VSARRGGTLDSLRQLGGPRGSLGGALATRTVPTVVKLALVLVVGRVGGLEQLGSYATVVALAYLLGALGELGLTTLLSVPERYLDAEVGDALRASRPLRVAVGLAGAAVVLAAVVAGFGGGGGALLWAVPLPAVLAAGFPQTGALNRLGMLRLEGRIAVAENVGGFVLTLALLPLTDVVTAALAGQVVGRGAGVAVRTLRLTRILDGPRRRVALPLRRIAPFAGFVTAMIVHGQADLVLLGAVGDPVTAGAYAPALRLAGATLLVGEAVSLAILPQVSHLSDDTVEARRPVLLAAVRASLGAGAAAAAFVLIGGPLLLRVVFADPPTVPVTVFLLLAAVPLLRFPGHVMDPWLTGHGQQAAKALVAAGSLVILLPAVAFASAAGSLVGLAAARLAGEIVLVAGWAGLTVRSLAVSRVGEEPA
jgi:O-antigen/teichoic acid export membrane protein